MNFCEEESLKSVTQTGLRTPGGSGLPGGLTDKLEGRVYLWWCGLSYLIGCLSTLPVAQTGSAFSCLHTEAAA